MNRESPLFEEESAPTEAEMSRSLQKFKEALKGWRTSPDGEDFCPDHWGVYLDKFDERGRKIITSYSQATQKLAGYRKMRDGWGTICQYEGKDKKACGRSVSVPYK